jgi:sucrose-6-phosphate hydrolase SacC (GH32 family)
MEPAPGTYYEVGTETPSVVKKDSTYHMYLTCYPPGNIASDFVIAHATSSDGITWNMDATPIIESDGSNSIYGDLVGEPGAVVYNDSIHLFFTAAGTVNAQAVQCIGLMKSADGTNFTAPEIAVQLPQDVYPLTDNYWGLSTPSALSRQ